MGLGWPIQPRRDRKSRRGDPAGSGQAGVCPKGRPHGGVFLSPLSLHEQRKRGARMQFKLIEERSMWRAEQHKPVFKYLERSLTVCLRLF